jgi:hypothetical protein
MHRRTAFATALASSWLAMMTAAPAQAEEFRAVQSLDRFVALTNGRDLRRFGIRVQVTPDGQIEGRAFGSPVTGAWTWDSGYFCRDLYWGGDDLGYNCQLVEENGDTLRFTSDRGAGMFADLTLR